MAAFLKWLEQFYPLMNLTEIFANEPVCKVLLKSIQEFGGYRGHTHTNVFFVVPK